MDGMNPHEITRQFELALCEYTGAPYAVAVDNCSNALFLALKYECIEGHTITIPERTYPSVPCEIIHAGGKVVFEPMKGYEITGAYQLRPTQIWDSALRFTAGMYIGGQTQCLSFTGPYKHLKLGKGGAILTDDPDAAAWYRRSRFSGRMECSYHDDPLTMQGWNFYMMPEIAAKGLLLLRGMYDFNGQAKENPDLTIPYPLLSDKPAYR